MRFMVSGREVEIALKPTKTSWALLVQTCGDDPSQQGKILMGRVSATDGAVYVDENALSVV